MSSSWFYKLRRKRSATGLFVRKAAEADQNQNPPPPSPNTPSAPCSPTPNRASYYFPSKDRALLSPRPVTTKGNPNLRFPPHQPVTAAAGDIVFDVVARRVDDRFGGVDEVMHQLKLRPIITTRTKSTTAARADGHDRPSDSDSSSSAASPTTTVVRLRRRRLHARATPDDGSRRNTVIINNSRLPPPADTCSTTRPRRRRRRGRGGKGELMRWMYGSAVVVVKESAEPEEDFLASMAEMIAAANDEHDDAVLRSTSPRRGQLLEELLACYLALNAAEHHGAIVSAFRRASCLMEDRCVPALPPPPTPPTLPRGRCHLHARCI